MADLQSALRTRVAAAIGHSRVYWGIAPQGKPRPYVRMQTVSDPRPQHLQAYHTSRRVRVQVDVFSDSYGEARGKAEAIISALAEPQVVDGVKFGRIKAEGPRDLGEDVPGVGYIHRASFDLLAEYSLT